MVIDFHAHYPRWETDFARRLVSLLPQAGIDQIVLFSAGQAIGHATNEQVLAAALAHPEHIIPFGLIELGHDAPAAVDRLVEQGFQGFKITNPRGPYDLEDYFPVYERMAASGRPLLAHTGILLRFPQPAGVRVNSDWMRPIRLDAVLRSFPHFNIVGAHLGAPWHDEASMMARIHPNFFVDLTGAASGGWRTTKTPEFFREQFFWKDAWDKVLFGTDILALDELVPAKAFHDHMIAQIGLPDENVRKVYGGNAARLLGR